MKSISLTPHEVRGLLSGSITKLAREMKQQPPSNVIGPRLGYTAATPPGYISVQGGFMENGERRFGEWFIKCPFQPGEVRWCKETWFFEDEYPTTSHDATRLPENPNVSLEALAMWRKCIQYKADYPTGSPDGTHDTLEPWGTWRSSIHMPQWASRLNIKFGPTRAVMLGDLTEADAEALGFCQWQSIETGQKSTALEMLRWYHYKVLKKQWDGSRWIWLTDVEVVR